MIREIKYRAWDVDDKQWIPADHIVVTGDGKIMTRDDVDEDAFLEETKPISIQQFTGLYDRDGREIYEGDILRHMSVNTKHLYEIRWGESTAAFHLKPILGKEDGGSALFRNSYGYYPYVIVGNIYENPELLRVAASE